jgi:hypothetical protein
MTTRYTLEQIREFIACPELGDDHYGKWDALTLEQRLVIANLLGIIRYLDRVCRELHEDKGLAECSQRSSDVDLSA